MSRKLIIVGNGLGMAVDCNHFSLKNALEKIWSDDRLLDKDHKALINMCTGSDNAPEGENELDRLHLAITSCEILDKISTSDPHWLSDYGKEFPDVTAKYIHKVATYLHNYDGELEEVFVEPLVNFIKETKSHIATLNYDKLLYSSFVENDIVSGYDGFLVDGMLSSGFAEENLERLYDKDFGYYLHLHGSPLFINKGSKIKKLSRDELTIDDERVGRHIVLTHVKHKPEVIAASNVLSTYWDYLRFSLSEVEEVILFGYSGLDTHLNKLIKPYLKKKNLKIIEWAGSGNDSDFWEQKLGKVPNLIQLDDITTFKDW